MATAPHVAVVGYRSSYPVALHMREQLMRLRGNVDILPNPGQSIGEDLVDYAAGDVIVIIGVGRRLPFFSRLIDVMLERGLTVVVIGDISARNAVIGRNVAFFKVVLNSHVLTSFTAAFALIALMMDEVGKCLVDTEDEVHARIEGINDCFDALDELED